MIETSTGVVDDDVDRDVDNDDIAIVDDETPPPAGLTRAQRERMRRTRNRRNELVAAAVAISLGVVAALVTAPRHATHTVAHAPAPAAPVAAARPHTTLVVHYDRTRRIDFAALAGVDAGGRAGSFVFVPPPTYVEVPALELQPIDSLLRVGDPALLLNVVENTTGVHVDSLAVLDDTKLARAFATVPSLTITFARPVTVVDGRNTLTYPGGRNTHIAPSQAVQLLVGREAGGTLGHLDTAQAVLVGWFDALRASPTGARRAAAIRGAAPFAALASVANMHYDVLPVTSSSATGGTGERFDPDQPNLDQLVRADFGFDRIGGDAARPQVELLNGVGVAGLTQRVARIVVPAGGYVKLTDNVAGFGERLTRVVYYDDSKYATALHFARVLGFGASRVARGAITLDSVDVTVVIGRDFLKGHP